MYLAFLQVSAFSLNNQVTGRTQNLRLPRVMARGWQECCWDEIGSGMFPENSIPTDPYESELLAYFSEELPAFFGFGSTRIYFTGKEN